MTYSWEYKGCDPINLLKWIGSIGVPGYIKFIPQESGPRTYRIHQTKERIQLPHLDHIAWDTERMMASACIKGWTGKRTPACPRGFSLALVPTADVAYSNCHPPVHLCTPGTAVHPSTWTQICPALHPVPEAQFWHCILTLQPATSILRFFWTWALCALPHLHWVHFTFLSDSSSALLGLLSHSITYIHNYLYP